MIQVKNITKNFGRFTAIDNISFEIKTGEIVGFLGPNGAGKTTTMRMLAGFLVPDKGSITINGLDTLEDEINVKSIIGYMPENNPIYKDLLVHEQLKLTLELNNIPKEKYKELIEYVVKAVGLEDVYYRSINELSKGYKQRVGIAQALITKPKVLILDEPTEGLDPNQRAEIRNLVKEIGQDRTIIISTHVMQEVEAMCNRIIIINKGQIVKDGSKEEIMSLTEGGTKILTELSGDNVGKQIQSLKSVSEIITKELKGKTQVEIILKEENKSNIFKELSELIAKNKWTIYKLESEKNTLEDIFHNLTTKKK